MDTTTKPMIRRRRRVERIVWELNGATVLAKALGVHPSAIWQWMQRDRIPAQWQGSILELAKGYEIPIGPEDLIG